VIQRHYDYPEGYRYGKGERPSRPEFRLMLLEQRIREARDARTKPAKRAATAS
jgi:hypothetical protein